jgi:hypothetical protein
MAVDKLIHGHPEPRRVFFRIAHVLPSKAVNASNLTLERSSVERIRWRFLLGGVQVMIRV